MKIGTLLALLDDKTRLGSLILLLFCGAFLLLSLSIPIDPTFAEHGFSARTLPLALSSIGMVCALAQRCLAPGGPRERLSPQLRRGNWARLGALIACMLAYALAFTWLGFLAGGALFLTAGFFILGERRVLLALAVALGLSGGLWLLLSRGFGLYLDPGELYRMASGALP